MSIRNKLPSVTVSPGFLLLLGFLFYLDDGSGVIIWTAAAAAVHESGHVAAAALSGGRTEKLTLCATGAELKFAYSAVLSYGREALVVLAGPAANLLAGVLLMWAGNYQASLISLGLGLFNLLPVVPLDGGRLLFSLISRQFGPECADCILTVSSGAVIGLLSGLGLISVMEYANFIPVILSGWLLLGALKKEKFMPKK